MAGGFSFPPPPPPPPKRAPAPLQSNGDYQSQQRGRGGTRGVSSSRGRGDATPNVGHASAPLVGGSNFIPLGVRGRGRDFNNGSSSREDAAPASHKPSSADYASGGTQPFPSSSSSSLPAFAGLPSGAHVNPRFLSQAGVPTAAVASKPGANYGSPTARYQRQVSPAHHSRGSPSSSDPDRTHAGHKRKLDALRGSSLDHDNMPNVSAVPAVPSFYAIPTASTTARPPVRYSSGSIIPGPRTKTVATASLGLVPRIDNDYDEPAESDNDDDGEDVDEEAQYAELGTRLTFEHNGEVMSLNNAADLAAWREARRKAFPTMMRVADREDDRRRTGDERRRLLADMHLLWRDVRTDDRKARRKVDGVRKGPSTSDMPARLPLTKLQQATRRLSDCTRELENLQRSFTQSEEQHQRLLDLYGIEGDQSRQSPPSELLATLGGVKSIEVADKVGREGHPDAAAVSAPSASGSSESSSDDSTTESDTDDEPPESTSSKPQAPANHAMGLCRYFAASGYCRDGDTCRFRHELSAKANAAFRAASHVARPAIDRFAPKLDKPASNSRKSIHERLVEQEEDEEDRLMLKAIKALGTAGLFAPSNDA
ncbi:hypothetical protein LTR95_004643 [Oleoguttula sp. CCFEE 5521]